MSAYFTLVMGITVRNRFLTVIFLEFICCDFSVNVIVATKDITLESHIHKISLSSSGSQNCNASIWAVNEKFYTSFPPHTVSITVPRTFMMSGLHVALVEMRYGVVKSCGTLYIRHNVMQLARA